MSRRPSTATAFTGLTEAEYAEIFRKHPTAGKTVPASIVPYLTAPLGLSEDEYEEWLDRLCTQRYDDL